LNYDSNIPYDLSKNGNFIKKARHVNEVSMRLADVKGSEIARAIDPKLATINLFANDGVSVYSEKISGYPRIRIENLPNLTKGFTPMTFSNGFMCDMKLKQYLSIDEFKHDKAMQKDFINQWLVTMSLGVLDNWQENNFPYFQYESDFLNGKGDFFIGKAFDFECCMHIICDEDIRNVNLGMFDAKDAFERGLTRENAKYLRAKHPETSKEFFDKLLAVDVDKICDFTKIKEPIDSNIESLSERATTGYKTRFKMLADQYSKGVTR
jgi:hypothetical protein